jgi:GNAT superfamily N-acetyltransferase
VSPPPHRPHPAEPASRRGNVQPGQRLATRSDEPRIATLMRSSVLELFPMFYDERQTLSAATYIAHVDRTLIDDGTYFVHEVDEQIVACGGWSKRDRLYTGSDPGDDDVRLLDPATEPARVRAMFVRGDWTRRGLGRAILTSCERAAHEAGFRTMSLMATLPGVPLYRSFGFTAVAPATVTMPDGMTIDAVEMQRPVHVRARPPTARA